MDASRPPIIEMVEIGKHYGHIRALQGVSLTVKAGEVTCVLGDNGAGKSTLIKIMSGLLKPDEGITRINGVDQRFDSPRDALRAGIATVYQDLAVVDLMETWRNFFLGSELRTPRALHQAARHRSHADDHGRRAREARDPSR